jgi:hypothetical protein
MTNLLERYLQAIGQYLPAARRTDVLAELRSNLLEQIDDLESQHGHPLNDAKIADVLRGHGRPALVASRYLPQHSLIGPTIFPFYWLALSRLLPLIVAVLAVAQAITTQDLSFALHQVLEHVFTVWASITLAFASFEFFLKLRGRQMPDWDPLKLPAIRIEAKQDSFAHRLANTIVSGLFVAWLFASRNHTHLILGGAATMHGTLVVLTPEWHILYWQIVWLMVGQFVLKLAGLLTNTPLWRQILGFAAQALGTGVLAILVQTREYFVPTGAISLPQELASINMVANLGFRIALVISAGSLIWQVWKAVREHSNGRTVLA